MKSIVLFGGTFNPIHEGHLAMCQAAYEACSPEKVILLPSPSPHYKKTERLLDPETRMRMCRLAVKTYPYIEVSDEELRQTGPVCTADTVKRMAQRFPGYLLYWLLGTDMLARFTRWYHWQEICQYVTLLVAPREIPELSELEESLRKLRQIGYEPRFLHATHIDISSTWIRNQAAAGDIPRGIPDSIRSYWRYYEKSRISL